MSGDRDASPEAKPPNLAGRYVNVIWAREIVVVGTAEKSKAVGQDFERPFAEHESVKLDPFLEDLKDQILLLESGAFRNVLLLGQLHKLADRHSLELGDVKIVGLEGLEAGVRFEQLPAIHEVGDFFR